MKTAEEVARNPDKALAEIHRLQKAGESLLHRLHEEQAESKLWFERFQGLRAERGEAERRGKAEGLRMAAEFCEKKMVCWTPHGKAFTRNTPGKLRKKPCTDGPVCAAELRQLADKIERGEDG